ncbi:virion structural protein [Cronobacter phage vB_CsaM_GAP32]|uniref:Uncharacterized protein n=1 Tax=Cronobacter phage vB_CsaM_GAP32 TaxID=1141136 RepID=K4F9L8_9CAUD|nr:virion structural protein [Cronobacter phage vB_CsaM_GAP32]AFC21740.1 hypothetical protein GAP32_290 [Cronobacter phage vB_CsaM_GAP32]
MDIQQTAQELQKFADANGLQMDVSAALSAMDAGDFVEINQAIDNSDNRTIMQVLQKYKAQMSENYHLFCGNKINESYGVNFMNSLTPKQLSEFFKLHCSFALTENSHLTLAEMKTLAYDVVNEKAQRGELDEDLASTLRAGQINKQATTTQQTQINPQTAQKLKQAELQKNANNANFKVTVPGDTTGTSEIEPVVGVDVGPTTDQTLVVTKDTSKPNQLSVFGLGDVEPVKEAEFEENDSEDVMAPPDVQHQEQSGSPFTQENPGLGELSREISKIEGDEYSLDGEESPEGNEAMNNADEILSQIIDFCSRMRGK